MPQRSRALLIGGGGVGTLTGFNLESGGRVAVTFILRSNYDIVREKGFTITSCDHGQHDAWRPLGGILREVPNVEAGPAFDWVICYTKNIPDVGQRLEATIRQAVTPGVTTIVLVQNGLGIEKPFVEAFPDNVCLSVVSFCGVQETSPGQILHNESDVSTISAFMNPTMDSEKQHQKARDFVRLYEASGNVKTSFHPDAQAVRWRKLLTNAVFNPICALTNLDTGRLRLTTMLDGPSIIQGLIMPAMREIQVAAFSVANVTLTEDDMNSAINSDSVRSFVMPSMQQDVQKGNYIEHEAILGEVCRAGQQHGVAMPIINTLYHLCRAVQFRTREEKGHVNVNCLADLYSESKG
ncbi:hypothetical protein CDV36_003695 [Fusarium kuroshium]|uniref:2-dehydropantoate 2-reductase n=1 Tax=Fusarium kuroshium TaxID=2010991 RepID=A0A3M2SGD3_9HYPO|nr:hypothetical protein CDV36_003695 [Fusarium kuroshium]